MVDADEKILGIEKELLEKFIILFRDHYRKTDEATLLIEQIEGISNVSGIANIRDALSHFVSALNPDFTLVQRAAQLTSAEEHLRRAIVEPYERAIYHRLVIFKPLYKKYKGKVLPNKRRYLRLENAPELTTIDTKLREIRRLMGIGRNSKGRSFSDPMWEEGLKNLIIAYDMLYKLNEEIEEYYILSQESLIEQRNQFFVILSIILGIISIILGIIALS